MKKSLQKNKTCLSVLLIILPTFSSNVSVQLERCFFNLNDFSVFLIVCWLFSGDNFIYCWYPLRSADSWICSKSSIQSFSLIFRNSALYWNAEVTWFLTAHCFLKTDRFATNVYKDIVTPFIMLLLTSAEQKLVNNSLF